jgi:signal peptidase II
MPFYVVLIIISACAIALDQLTKWLIYFNLPIGEVAFGIDGLFEITHIRNDGMAFGLLDEHRWIFIVASIIGICVISVYLFRFSSDNRFTKIGLALVIGGGLGNMVDRIVLGEVVDMIHITIFNDFFPYVFNVADSCVCVGVGMAIVGIVYDIIKEAKSKKTKDVGENDNQ